MKSATLILLFLFPLMMARTCARDSEESYDDSPVVYYQKDENVTREMAIENWETFIRHSQDAIDLSECDIEKLTIKIEEADDYKKSQLMELCSQIRSSLNKLKTKRDNRYHEFQDELTDYNRTVYERNESFEKQFYRDISDIDDRLGNLFLKLYSHQ